MATNFPPQITESLGHVSKEACKTGTTFALIANVE